MEYSQMTKHIIDMQKISFDNWYSAVCQVQDQAASMLGKAAWLPAEGRQSIQNWINSCQNERERFKSYVHKGFNDLEKLVSDGLEQSSRVASSFRKATEKQLAI